MKDKVNKIFSVMDQIEYGFKDSSGQNIINDLNKWDNEFDKFYYLQMLPDHIL